MSKKKQEPNEQELKKSEEMFSKCGDVAGSELEQDLRMLTSMVGVMLDNIHKKYGLKKESLKIIIEPDGVNFELIDNIDDELKAFGAHKIITYWKYVNNRIDKIDKNEGMIN